MELKDFTLTSESFEAEIEGINKTIEMKTYTADVQALGEKVELTFDPDNIKIDLKDYVNLIEISSFQFIYKSLIVFTFVPNKYKQ